MCPDPCDGCTRFGFGGCIACAAGYNSQYDICDIDCPTGYTENNGVCE